MPAALRASRFRMPVRALPVALFGALVLVLVMAPGAMADAFSPESGGGTKNAEAIDTLYWIALGLGFLIFLLVEGVLIYVLVKHRFRRGGPEPAQIRGNTRLEVGWTIGAAVLLVVLATVTFFYLGDIKNPPASGDNGLFNAAAVQNQYATIDQPKPPGPARSYLTINVNGQQYLWRYRYPNGAFSYYDMVVPYDTTVVLNITSSDVAHSWWIPKLGGKADAIPPVDKYVNHTWFKITKKGNGTYKQYTGAAIFTGQCAELCGDNHADMRARVIALPVDQYRRWVEQQKREIDEAHIALSKQREARGTRE
jgi:cytochrome c oxidase subunit II